MRYCNSCKVTVTGDKKRCPLCRNLLSGTAEPDTDVFPTLPPPRYSRHLLYKLVTLTAISAILLTGFAAAFAWVYSYLCNTYLSLGMTLSVNLTMFIAPALLVVLLILLLIIRPTKRVKKIVTEDIDE